VSNAFRVNLKVPGGIQALGGVVVLIDRHQRYEPTMGVGQRHRDVTCVEVEYRRGLDPLVGLGLPSYSLSSAMVLTAILTAISDRSAVFAGVRCRTDSLTGKDLTGKDCTAADAVPVSYKQVLRTAGTGWVDSERSTSSRSASRCVDRLGSTVRY
jgi:hypothetical protein